MVEDTKQVRVDNWGIFFLQRLQMFFSKTDYCDLTLQFEGNVQLKVHKLVLNACTEYFQFLEDTCSMEDHVILMPADLQADVIVPIINFMYTGMLEFQLALFDRLYRTAQVMNITILIKLLEAQRQSVNSSQKQQKRKIEARKSASTARELPAALPGRKLPVWKRQKSTIPSPLYHHPEPKWMPPPDPLSIPDNTPKPTRFEWPDDDLPTSMNLLDTSFDDISYTSRPLLTKQETERSTFDELKHIPDSSCSADANNSAKSPVLDMDEIQDYVQEQKIRSVLHEEDIDGDLEEKTVKKIKLDDGTSTISVTGDVKSGDLDHEKIVSEILKKYPQLVKKNKNIKLKIMTKNKMHKEQKQEAPPVVKKAVKTPVKPKATPTTRKIKEVPTEKSEDDKTPWVCVQCSTADECVEFVLYYLYRKHMSDVHGEPLDTHECRYCGHKCSKDTYLHYHLFTKHGMQPPALYDFPKCHQCPYIALSDASLSDHQSRHVKGEVQCRECKLAFNSTSTLTNHMQITGHSGKLNRTNYDCQYCTKRYPNAIYLFSHVRAQHRNEGRRDGIVSIDEADEVEEQEDIEEEEEPKDEYILPEIIDQTPPPKKVNILSNVKVQDKVPQQTVTLEQPSSEAEALNNVASGIATSLGLVDIVVLNDNQQLFMDETQHQEFRDERQPEFILPELAGQNLSGDIGSTDELVMVLTDHDYGDAQEEVVNDSNIVVLYSHPVDGQQEQFITSQGNLMVNSETGMLELRNGATLTNEHQLAIGADTPIESIEMIQREIESHGEMKARVDDEEMKKASEALVHSLEQGEQIEFVAEPEQNPRENEENPREDEENHGLDEENPGQNEEDQVQHDENLVQNEENPLGNEENSEETQENPPQDQECVEHEEMTVETAETHQEDQEAMETTIEEKNEELTKSDEETSTLEEQEMVQETSEETHIQNNSTEVHETPEEVMEVEEAANQQESHPETAEESSEISAENCEAIEENTVNNAVNEEAVEKTPIAEDTRAKIAILDDWDDTDSQQSEHKNEETEGQSVEKLIDDWEEDEDEEKRAQIGTK